MRCCGALLVLLASSSQAAPSVCIVEFVDPRAQASTAVVATLEAALAEAFTFVPTRRLSAEAWRLRLPRSSWVNAPTLEQLTEATACDTPVRARLMSTRGQWSLSLTRLVRTTGAETETVSVLLGKPRLPLERARALAADLSLRLLPSEPASSVVTPAEPPSPALPKPADDAAWSVTGFDATPAPSLTESLKLETTVEVGGRVAFEHYAFFENVNASLLGGRDNVEAALRVKAAHPRATVFASVLARADFVDPSRNRFDPEEAWVELTFPHVSLKVGRLLVSTGTASLYNPSDVLNHFDLRDPLDPEKVGALMARAVATFGPVTLEAAVLPVPESHWFPEVSGVSPSGELKSRSRWVRGTVDVAGSVPVTYRLAPLRAQTPRPANTQAFGRMEVSVAGADVGIGYGWLVDHVPSALVEAVPAVGLPMAEVFVDWNYRRLHVITVDMERTFGKLRLIAEGAAFLTADLPAQNPRVADPYVIGVVGGDLETPEFLGQQKVHLFLEFALARALSGQLTLDGLDSFRYPFPLTILGRVSWAITEDLVVEVNVFSSVERVDLLLSPRVEYQFFDRVKLRLGADVMAGDRTRGFFGAWANNSRYLATVEAGF